jgi:peptide/nickel transport system permease protein
VSSASFTAFSAFEGGHHIDTGQDLQTVQAPEVSGPIDLSPVLQHKRKGQLRLIVERFVRNRAAVSGLLFLFVLALLAIFAPFLTGQTATYDPATDTNVTNNFAPPFSVDPSNGHFLLLGSDDVGRSELARLLFGGRISLTVGLLTAIVAITVAVTIGSLAGFYGGWLDTIMMRFTDAVLAVPLYLALFVISDIILAHSRGGNSVLYIVLLIAAFAWTRVARVIRAELLSLKQREYLLAARTLGARDWRLIIMHILPNAMGPILVAATLTVGDAIILESILSFFGFGVQVPTATWGTMLTDSQSFISSDPLLLYLPGLAILATVLSVNLVGDGLRDAFDPYQTQR